MPRIAENIFTIQQKLGNCKLIVVSKYRSIDEITEAYAAGQRTFAENRVQALLERKAQLPNDIEWHLIGHLQTNKVKSIVPFISMIHSVDSLKLIQTINREAEKCDKIVPCLLQIYVAKEETKFGLDEGELIDLLEKIKLEQLDHIRICGIMAMATFTDDKNQIAEEFSKAQSLFNQVKQEYFNLDTLFRELSIGMSSDYEIALDHGSTMVRVGSAVFN